MLAIATGIRRGGYLALMCWLLVLPIAARAECQLHKMATVPLTLTRGTITVPVEVNGITATFILDSGAQRSMVTEAAVQRLGLARDPWVGTTISGIGGVNRRANANPRSLSLAGIPLVRRTLNHDTSLTVGALPGSVGQTPVIDGLLGRDYLAMFDLDLDVPAHRLTLYQPTGCSGRFLPWSGDYVELPVTIPAESALVVPVVLDGAPLRALLDTGANASLLAAPGIYRLRLDLAGLGADPEVEVSGAGPRTVMMHHHQFRSLRVGGQTTNAPLVWVAPIQLPVVVDMLLGTDWLTSRRIWISYATKQIFVAGR